MIKGRRPLSQIVNLREVAATVFALTAVLPLLIFLSLLSRFELIRETEAQISLFLALMIAVLGFVVVRRMVEAISRLAEAVGASRAAELAPILEKGEAHPVPGVGAVAEIVQIREAFDRMLADLRGSTERLEDLVFKLVTLNEMVELAARIPKMEDLLALVLERTIRTVKASLGSIMLLDREDQMLRIAAARGLPDEVLAGIEVRVGEGLEGQVAQRGEPVLIDDLETDPRFAKTNVRKYGGGSLLCLPVRVGERVIGVITLAKKKHGAVSHPDSQPFTPTDLQFLNPLMSYIAYALDNAWLFEETKRSAKRLQEVIDELRAAQEQLVRGQTLRAMGVLASGVTHHLNNLLAVIQGRIQFLLPEVQDVEVFRRSLEMAERAALEAADVVRQVREFGQVQPIEEAVPVDLNRLAQEVLELTRPHWQDEARLRGIQIEASLEPGEIPALAGDLPSLREVLMSLLLNAVDALPAGGRITVRTWASDQWVWCSVADTGVGMSEEVRRRALEPFFTTKGPKSTGLGLSVTYGLILRHGGDVAIDSEKGRGTTVQIRLPVAANVSKTLSAI